MKTLCATIAAVLVLVPLTPAAEVEVAFDRPLQTWDGFGVNYVILGLAPSLGWLFVARVLSGITGASITTCNAYIADISSPENRA